MQNGVTNLANLHTYGQTQQFIVKDVYELSKLYTHIMTLTKSTREKRLKHLKRLLT